MRSPVSCISVLPAGLCKSDEALVTNLMRAAQQDEVGVAMAAL